MHSLPFVISVTYRYAESTEVLAIIPSIVVESFEAGSQVYDLPKMRANIFAMTSCIAGSVRENLSRTDLITLERRNVEFRRQTYPMHMQMAKDGRH